MPGQRAALDADVGEFGAQPLPQYFRVSPAQTVGGGRVRRYESLDDLGPRRDTTVGAPGCKEQPPTRLEHPIQLRQGHLGSTGEDDTESGQDDVDGVVG